MQSSLFYLRPRDPDPPPRRSREPRRSSTEPPAREIRPDSRSHRVFSAFAVRPVPSAFACGEHAEASSQLLSNRQTGKRCWPTTFDVDCATRVERSKSSVDPDPVGGCGCGCVLVRLPSRSNALDHPAPQVACDAAESTQQSQQQRLRTRLLVSTTALHVRVAACMHFVAASAWTLPLNHAALAVQQVSQSVSQSVLRRTHRSCSISPSDHGVAGVFGTWGDARFCLPCGARLGAMMLRGSCSARGIHCKQQTKFVQSHLLW